MADEMKPRHSEDYGTLAAEVWFATWKFCGCGTSHDIATALQSSLRLLEERSNANSAEHGNPPYLESAFAKHTEAMKASMQEIWTPERVRYLVWYVLCAADLEEHGGSVPGWPTDKGRKFLAEPVILDEEEWVASGGAPEGEQFG